MLSKTAYGGSSELGGLAVKKAVEALRRQEEFEKNRLAACNRQTEEECEREKDFVDKVLLGEHRQPTYSDAIEYGIRWQLSKLPKWKKAINRSCWSGEIGVNPTLRRFKYEHYVIDADKLFEALEKEE